jgi:acyl-CoA dehydrogenase-like protein
MQSYRSRYSASDSCPARARIESDRIVSGQKRWCSGGAHADADVVYYRLSDAPGAAGIGAALVKKGAPGLSFGRPEVLMGFRGAAVAMRMRRCDCLSSSIPLSVRHAAGGARRTRGGGVVLPTIERSAWLSALPAALGPLCRDNHPSSLSVNPQVCVVECRLLGLRGFTRRARKQRQLNCLG